MMKKCMLILLLLFLPTTSFAGEDDAFPVTGDTVGLWYFNGSSIGSSAGVDESGNGNDFAVATSLNAPAYGESGYAWVDSGEESDEAVDFTDGDGLATSANADLAPTDFTFELVMRQDSIPATSSTDYHYLISYRPTGAQFNWQLVNYQGGYAAPSWGVHFITRGNANAFNSIIGNEKTSTANNDNWMYYCGIHNSANIGSNTLNRVAVGILWNDPSGGSDTDLFWDNKYFGANGTVMQSVSEQFRLGHNDVSPAGYASLDDSYSTLHIMDVAQTTAWCESRFDELKDAATWEGEGGRIRFIIN